MSKALSQIHVRSGMSAPELIELNRQTAGHLLIPSNSNNLGWTRQHLSGWTQASTPHFISSGSPAYGIFSRFIPVFAILSPRQPGAAGASSGSHGRDIPLAVYDAAFRPGVAAPPFQNSGLLAS
jgi:hypothetical protein